MESPSPPPFGAPRPRQLRRRPDQGPIAGVCAGIAEYFNVDPVIVRIATVVLALGGPGVIAYVLAWIFVPAVPESTDIARQRHRRLGPIVMGALIAWSGMAWLAGVSLENGLGAGGCPQRSADRGVGG